MPSILMSTDSAAMGNQDRVAILAGLTPREEESGATRTLGSSDHGKRIVMTNTVPSTLTLAKTATAKTEVVVDNISTGGVQFIVESGAPEPKNLLDYTLIADGGTMVFRVISNPDGSSALWKIMGEGE